MNTVNLTSIKSIYSQSENLCLKSIEIKSNSIKKSELKDLISLINEINQEGYNSLTGFFIGYEIPQISQEFDLLKFSSQHIINIELKRQSSIERIENQLQRCKHYLRFLGLPVHSYTYVSKDNKLYKLDKDNNIEESNISDLISVLETNRDIVYDTIDQLDRKFSLENYLISPFNDTESFLNSRYFLTSQQNEVKRNIIKSIKPKNANILAVNGNPGTGKTLLNLDLYVTLSQANHNVLFLSCIMLNQGHYLLIKKDFNIIHIKDFQHIDFKKFKYIIIDESQRMHGYQYDFLIKKCIENNCTLIFSIDPKQCLHSSEFATDILGKLEDDITNDDVLILSTKIRTNPSVAQFIGALLNKEQLKPNSKVKGIANKVKIEYFDSKDEANRFITSLEQYVNDEWKILSYTSSCINKESYHLHSKYDNSHNVIGQEFDNVCIYMNEIFGYNANQILGTKGVGHSYYSLGGMFFQNITRTRNKLCIVIVNNIELYKYCMQIISFYQRD